MNYHQQIFFICKKKKNNQDLAVIIFINFLYDLHSEIAEKKRNYKNSQNNNNKFMPLTNGSGRFTDNLSDKRNMNL